MGFLCMDQSYWPRDSERLGQHATFRESCKNGWSDWHIFWFFDWRFFAEFEDLQKIKFFCTNKNFFSQLCFRFCIFGTQWNFPESFLHFCVFGISLVNNFWLKSMKNIAPKILELAPEFHDFSRQNLFHWGVLLFQN